MTKILFGGDVMLGRGVNASIADMKEAKDPWCDLIPIFNDVDFSIVNLECAITTNTEPWKRSPKAFYFRADPGVIKVLQAAKITACSLANNHILDFEVEGLVDTLLFLDEAGIQHAGAGLDLEQASRGMILTSQTVPPVRVGFFAATDNEPLFAATADRPGTKYFPIDLDVEILSWIGDQTRLLRALGADIVVFSMHWGPNMVYRPSPLFRRFAQAVIDRGVDVFHGHSAHLTQGIEVYRGKPILYDTGDLLDDYVVDPELRNDWSFLFKLSFEGSELREIELIPLSLSIAHVRSARGADRKRMVERMANLSQEFGTQFKIGREGHLLWTAEKPKVSVA